MSYVRVAILGTLTGGEVWSINPVFDPAGELETSVDQAALDAATQAIADLTIPTNVLSKISAAGTRTGARLEVRADANDALLAISSQASATPVSGTINPQLPPQSSLVVSLRTNTPGGSGRGRLYWPCLNTSLDTSGRIPGPAVTAFVTDFKTYLTGMKNALTTAFPLVGFDLAVRSKSTHSTPHVTRIQVGNVVDTQRRRRDKLQESYTALNIP